MLGVGNLEKVFQTQPAIDFLFGTNAIKGLPTSGEALIDAIAWIVGQKIMVGVASGEYVVTSAVVSITLPVGVSSIDQVLYGDMAWAVNGNTLMKKGLKGLELCSSLCQLAMFCSDIQSLEASQKLESSTPSKPRDCVC